MVNNAFLKIKWLKRCLNFYELTSAVAPKSKRKNDGCRGILKKLCVFDPFGTESSTTDYSCVKRGKMK